VAEHDGAASVRVCVLGSLELHVDDHEVDVGGRRRRALLATLALAKGQTVSVDAIVDAVWPDDDPDMARRALLGQISRLRALLGPAGSDLERVGRGYRLRGDTIVVDVDEVRALVAEARTAVDDPRTARERYLAAVAWWRGEPLAEFADLPRLAADAVVLTELRAAVVDGAIAAGLAAGLHADLVDEATSAAQRDPLRESTTMLLMRVLAASGRPADALRAAHDHRRRVREATGLDPSPALAALEREIAGGGHGPAPATGPASGGTATATTPTAGQGAPTPIGRPPTPLLGREAELAELRRLVDVERLVTVAGPGGVGKTRLATELAADVHDAGGRGVTFVALAAVGHDEEVVEVLAAALGLRPATHAGALDACREHLTAGEHLIVFDNCEHVLAGCRAVVDALLAACPAATVVATSREPLGLTAEHVARLGPLPTVGDGAAPAIALFTARARRVRHDFVLDDTSRRVVEHLVGRLDGLPLAIELAAGRLHSFSLGDLATRLDRALDLLAGGGSDGQERHQTLRQTIAWSYALLTDDQRTLLRHLAVFSDGFDLATAERISQALGHRGDPASGLARLVDASLVTAAFDGDTPRYRMLETIRGFAAAELGAEQEERAAERLLTGWALDLLDDLTARWDTPDEAAADTRLRRELANLRAARRAALDRGEVDLPVAIALALDVPSLWRDLSELWSWTVELLDIPAVAEHPDRPAVLGAAARALWLQGDLDRAEATAGEALALAPTTAAAGSALDALAAISLFRGDMAAAEARWLQSSEDQGGQPASVAGASLGITYGGDPVRGAALAAQALEGARAMGAPSQIAFVSYTLGEAHAARGSTEAEALLLAARDGARTVGASFVESVATVGLLTVWSRAGRRQEARRGYRGLVEHWRRTGSWTQQWTTLRNLARELADDRPAEALALLEAADAAPEASALVGAAIAEHQALRDGLIAVVGPDAASISARARATPRVVVVEHVLTVLDELLAEDGAEDGSADRSPAGRPAS
jgi:predicted ATPase/DNA-binding SARP family transcriptional activator